MNEAARHLGVTRPTINRAKIRGTLETVGLGTHNSGIHTGRTKRMAAPIVIRGKEYCSGYDAAAAFGISSNTVDEAIMRGTEDNIGLGMRVVPVTIDGVVYPSKAEAARKLNKPYGQITNYLASGTFVTPYKERKLGRPVIVNGVKFKNKTEAKRTLGLSNYGLIKAMQGKNPHENSGKSIHVQGETYDSIAAFARARGVSYSAAYDAYKNKRLEAVGNGRVAERQIVWGETLYESAKALADQEGVSVRSIYGSMQYGTRRGQRIKWA